MKANTQTITIAAPQEHPAGSLVVEEIKLGCTLGMLRASTAITASPTS
jgi:hypothetical protein